MPQAGVAIIFTLWPAAIIPLQKREQVQAAAIPEFDRAREERTILFAGLCVSEL